MLFIHIYKIPIQHKANSKYLMDFVLGTISDERYTRFHKE